VTGSADSIPETGDGERLFVSELATIERAIAFTCRRAGFQYADAEDFGSYVKLRLIEHDYAIVRKYEGRCSFAGYMSVVVQRMLIDYRIHLWGKWHASSEAKRLGPGAVALESLLRRDGLTIDEALSTLHRADVAMTREEAEAIAAKLPVRSPRRRTIDLHGVAEEELAASVDEPRGPSPFVADRTALSRRVATVIRSAVEQLPDSDQLLFRLRFEAGMTVATIARTLQVDQKPLYRRIDRLLAVFRASLQAAGMTADDAEALIGDPASDLDFGFSSEKLFSCPSHQPGAEQENEEAR